MRDEYEVAGVPWRERGARLDEMLEVFDKLWNDNPVEHHGRFIDIPPSRVDLRPAQPGGPPVLLGGFSPAALTRVGTRGAGWIAIAGAPEEFEEQLWGIACDAAAGAAATRGPYAARRASTPTRARLSPRPSSRCARQSAAAPTASTSTSPTPPVRPPTSWRAPKS
jgi:alkanesulfonate monooxygenase SsuD/methylene tetrahydromethanopterin reductase-like flavin-dependent oxidoreductase (luciferase family)